MLTEEDGCGRGDRIRTLLCGATEGRPATPCAQGKLGRAAEVLNPERFAAVAIRCDQIWDQSSGDSPQTTANRGNEPSRDATAQIAC